MASFTDPRSWFAWGRRVAMMAIWPPDPLTQIAVNLVIIIFAAVSSAVTWGAGLLIAIPALFFLGVGVARLSYRLLAGWL